MQDIKPEITLVGAGPGDPELLTIKGLRALERANVVLYDALSSKELLAFAPAKALRIYVGKRAGTHYKSQEEINLLIIQYAYQYGHVVRLKGGDPFVFGRGYEEVEYIRAFGIEPVVVPGISSATSLPALQGVPITSRGYSEGFWVITGTTRHGELSKDIQLAAQSRSTVIILMGIRKLREITELFQAKGKGDLPAMVIQNGSRSEERYAIGTVAEIAEIVTESGIGAPGIIVIGKTVGLHRDWEQEESGTFIEHVKKLSYGK